MESDIFLPLSFLELEQIFQEKMSSLAMLFSVNFIMEKDSGEKWDIHCY